MENYKVIEENQNPLFNRKEVSISVNAEVTPKREEVLKLLSEKFSVGEDAIKIRKIDNKFGSKEFTITANVYPSKEEKEKVERKTKKEIEEEKKASEAAKAAAEAKEAEEAKAKEAPHEEVKSEEKPEEKPAEIPKKETKEGENKE